MPEYIYKCRSCEIVFEIFHSIKEKIEDCDHCGENTSLERVPSLPLILKKNNNNGIIGKPGEMVKDFISDAKEEMKREKKRLSEREK